MSVKRVSVKAERANVRVGAPGESERGACPARAYLISHLEADAPKVRRVDVPLAILIKELPPNRKRVELAAPHRAHPLRARRGGDVVREDAHEERAVEGVAVVTRGDHALVFERRGGGWWRRGWWRRGTRWRGTRWRGTRWRGTLAFERRVSSMVHTGL